MEIKKYKLENEEYMFNFLTFNDFFDKKRKKEKLKVKDLEIDLAKQIFKSSDAIHNWRLKINAPSDLETIKLISEYFNIKDYKIFLLKKENLEMKQLTHLQILSIHRIYNHILDFLDEFNESNGFNDYWRSSKNSSDQESKLYDIALLKVEKVILSYKKEYPLLKNLKIYLELGNYIYNDLYETFDGKLSYAYRFEAISSDGVTTEEDYSRALNKINAIIDKYM